MALSIACVRAADPFLDREQSNYAHPLPSREYVLQILTEQGVPIAEAALASLLEINQAELGTFTRRLQAMERDGQIMFNRKGAICILGQTPIAYLGKVPRPVAAKKPLQVLVTSLQRGS